MKLEISLLGAFCLNREGSPEPGLESDKVRALLAYLAVERDRQHRREALAGLFWPDVPEARARRSLSQALYNLRSSLEDRSNPLPLFLITPQTLQFNPASGVWVDVNAFNHLLEECERHAHTCEEACDPCLETLVAAADLYRGNFLEALSLPDSLGFEEWVLSQRERLRLKALSMLGRLAKAYELRGAYPEALNYARRYTALESFDEEGHQQVMRLLALTGQRNAALRQYETCRLILEGELGVNPNRNTTELAEMIRRGTPVEGFGASADRALPAALTPFVGRAPELAEIRALLADPACRLVTLLGPGGCGKTRLALEAVRKLGYHFRDGVHLVPLSAIASVEGLIPTITTGVGFAFREGGDPFAQLRDYLRDRQLLLVLDSFETVAAGAGQVAELLRAAPEVKALVTSRVRLNLKGEKVYPVEGMRHPEKGADLDLNEHSAVALFVEAAQRVDPDFELTADNRAPVGEICRLLEGMPLGVLLASIWIDMYSLDEIAGEIRRNLDFLNVGWVDVPERQRSLRATFEYSWEMLVERERELISGLAVFRGRINRVAAEAVVGARGPELLKLVDKTMLGVVEAGQYQMHDLIRQYALEKLAEAPEQEAAVRARHSGYYCGLAEEWGAALKTARQAETLLEMDREIENVRAGWLWAVRHGLLERVCSVLEGVCLYYNLRFRYAEGVEACAQALAELGDLAETGAQAVETKAGLQVWQAHFYRVRGEAQTAGELLAAAEGGLEEDEGLDSHAPRMLALLHSERGMLNNDLRERLYHLQTSADHYRKLGEAWWLAEPIYWIQEVNIRLGDFASAERVSREAIDLSRELEDPRVKGRILISLAFLYGFTGQIQKMQVTMEAAAGIYRSSQDPGLREKVAWVLGVAGVWNGQFIEACRFLEESLESLRAQGDHYSQCFVLMSLGICYVHLCEFELAWDRLQEGLALAVAGGHRREQAGILIHLSQIALVKGEPGQAFRLAREGVAVYHRMAYVTELVVAQSILALAESELGQLDAASESLQEALRIGIANRYYPTGIYSLPAAALLLARGGRDARAIDVLAQVLQEPFVRGSHWYPALFGEALMATARQRLAEMGPFPDDGERIRRAIATAATLLEELAD